MNPHAFAVVVAFLLLCAQGEVDVDCGTYHSQSELESALADIHAACPNITSTFSIGESVEGRELVGIVFSDNGGAKDPGEPEFKYVGNMHGDETVGREVLICWAEQLCNDYTNNVTRVVDLVDNTAVYILPSMNPDGYADGKRRNANNKDLNRDFPDHYTDPVNTNAGRQPETIAIMEWTNAHTFVLSANFHGGALVASYGYDGRPGGQSGGGVESLTPDQDVMFHLATVYATTHTTMSTANDVGVDGVTNGADWYCLYGGMQDWNYVYGNSFEVTMELSKTKKPAESNLPTQWTRNKPALLAYAEQVHKGVKGFVTDENNNTLAATIDVDEIGHAIRNHPDQGDYYRLLRPGVYTLSASAPGYATSTVEGVVVTEGNVTVLNFTLRELGSSAFLTTTSTSSSSSTSTSLTSTVAEETTSSSSSTAPLLTTTLSTVLTTTVLTSASLFSSSSSAASSSGVGGGSTSAPESSSPSSTTVGSSSSSSTSEGEGGENVFPTTSLFYSSGSSSTTVGESGVVETSELDGLINEAEDDSGASSIVGVVYSAAVPACVALWMLVTL